MINHLEKNGAWWWVKWNLLNVLFKMTDSVSVDLTYDEGTDVLYAVKNGADPFQIDLVITNN